MIYINSNSNVTSVFICDNHILQYPVRNRTLLHKVFESKTRHVWGAAGGVSGRRGGLLPLIKRAVDSAA